MNVQTARQLPQTNARLVSDHAERPHLRAAETHPLFDLLEMRPNRVENDAKTAQHHGRLR
jgi:hypothetical protein